MEWIAVVAMIVLAALVVVCDDRNEHDRLLHVQPVRLE